MQHYTRAFRHKSNFKSAGENNERLELLGDSIICSVITEDLLKRFPAKSEGYISNLRSRLVNGKQFNALAKDLRLMDYLSFDKRSTNNFHKRLPGNTFEALIGALYLTEGFNKTRSIVNNVILQDYLDVDEVNDNDTDYKSALYIYVQRKAIALDFQLQEEKLIGNRSFFVMQAVIDGEVVAVGEGYSKKEAEQLASKACLDKMTED